MGQSLSDRTIVFFALLLVSILPAQAEVKGDQVTLCTEITALPALINTSGIHCLKKDLTHAGTTGIAIDVRRPNVTIDLNGFTITGGLGAATQSTGIHSLNRRNVTIRNGTLRGFLVGIFIDGKASFNLLIENVHLDQVRGAAVRIDQASQTVFQNNQITNAGGTPGEFDNNVAVALNQTKNTTISNNLINGVGANFGATGIQVNASELTEVRDNSVLNVVGGNTGFSIIAVGSNNTTIHGNRVLNSTNTGNFGILGSGGTEIYCVNNLVSSNRQIAQPLSGCTFASGNIVPP